MCASLLRVSRSQSATGKMYLFGIILKAVLKDIAKVKN